MAPTTAPYAWMRAPRRVLAPVAAVLTVVTALVAATAGFLADRGLAVVHHCVDLPGGWGAAGMYLALVRPEADCPTGAALGADPGAMVTVLGVLAVPVLVAHAFAAALAWGVSALVARAHARSHEVVVWAVRTVRAVQRLVRRTGRVVRVSLRRAVPAVPDDVPAALHHLADAVVRSRRGPPAVVLA